MNVKGKKVRKHGRNENVLRSVTVYRKILDVRSCSEQGLVADSMSTAMNLRFNTKGREVLDQSGDR
jgi:hypothetical protein